MVGHAVAMTVSSQRDFVTESFQQLAPSRQYIFLLLILERLFTMCRMTFPVGLPTRMIPYEQVGSAVDVLWGRLGSSEEQSSLERISRTWLPLTSTGVVEHRPGAAIGFHVADLISRLATTDLDQPADRQLDVAWETMQSLLFRLPENPDYSKSIVDSELDRDLNASLLLEYETQRVVLVSLREPGEPAVDELRHKCRQAAEAIADREHDRLVAS